VIHHHWTIAPARLPAIYYGFTKRGAGATAREALDPGAHASVPFLCRHRPTGTEGCEMPHALRRWRTGLIMGPVSDRNRRLRSSLAPRFVGYPADGAWGGAALSRTATLVPSFADPRSPRITTTAGARRPDHGRFDRQPGLETTRGCRRSRPTGCLYVAEVPTRRLELPAVSATDGALKRAAAPTCAPPTGSVARHAATINLIAKGGDPARDGPRRTRRQRGSQLVIYGRGPEIGCSLAITPSMPNAGTF
jgi:hypothetical protein